MSDQSVSLPEVKPSAVQPTDTRSDSATAPPNMDARVPSQQATPSEETKGDSSQGTPDRDLLEQQLEELNREYEQRNISVRFSVDETTDAFIIKVLDLDTDKVIRQFPPEELLAVRRRMHEMLGEIFDATA